MKVLIVLTYYLPHWTGLTQYAAELAKGLTKLGHEVTVLSTKHQDNLKKKEVLDGVIVIRTRPTFKISRSIVSLEMLGLLPENFVRSDLIFAFLPLNEALLLGIMCLITNKKLYFVHNGDLVLPKGIINRVIEAIFFVSTLTAIKMSKGIIVNTTDYAMNSHFLTKCREKWINLLPPLSPLTDTKTRIVDKKIKGPVFGFAGRFVEEKAFDILLKAIPLVVSRLPDAKFVFAGETNVGYENTFKRNADLIRPAKDSLIFLGKIPREDMGSFYKACDLIIISSRSDFFPFVQVEALLAGVPSVVTDIPGARWLVKTTGAGVVVPKEDPEALAEGILKAWKEREELTLLTKKVRKLFDVPRILQSYESLAKTVN